MSTLGNMAKDPDRGGTEDPWQRYGWLMAVVWMLFLFFPIRELIQSSAATGWLALGWVGLAAFAILYCTGFVLGMRSGWGQLRRSVFVMFWLLLVCAAATIPAIDWGALSFLPFLMAYGTFGLRGRWHWVVTIGALLVAGGAALIAGAGSNAPTILGIVVMLAIVNSINLWLIGRSVQAEDLRLDLATSQEREAVARDVHDLIGHTLTVVKLKAELARKLVDRDPERAKTELDAISGLTAEAISGVRSTVTGLRASELGEQLLASRDALESAGLETQVDGDVAALSPAQSIAASWILREATTNILRHAQADQVTILMRPGVLVVQDNGTGAHGRENTGQRGMVERASASGAVLTIESVPGRGTSVRAEW